MEHKLPEDQQDVWDALNSPTQEELLKLLAAIKKDLIFQFFTDIQPIYKHNIPIYKP